MILLSLLLNQVTLSLGLTEQVDDKSEALSLFWSPLGSVFVPGFSQYLNEEVSDGLIYTGIAASGAKLFLYSVDNFVETLSPEEASYELSKGYMTKNRNLRNLSLGTSLYFGSGSFSAYSGFRNRISSHYKDEFSFITKNETVSDILLAPFQFKHLKKATTWGPLLLAAALATIDLSASDEELEDLGLAKTKFTSTDGFYTAAYSYGAGTYEEALFRGWLMPLARYYTESDFMANALSSSAFALAHLGSQDVPVIPLALGYYLGYVSQLRGWTLSESVFIHAWWDVFAFAALYHTDLTDDPEVVRVPFIFPPLRFSF